MQRARFHEYNTWQLIIQNLIRGLEDLCDKVIKFATDGFSKGIIRSMQGLMDALVRLDALVLEQQIILRNHLGPLLYNIMQDVDPDSTLDTRSRNKGVDVLSCERSAAVLRCFARYVEVQVLPSLGKMEEVLDSGIEQDTGNKGFEVVSGACAQRSVRRKGKGTGKSMRRRGKS
jgi:hypothetical protein